MVSGMDWTWMDDALNSRRDMVVCGSIRFRVVDSNLFDVMISASNSVRFISCPVQIVETHLNCGMSIGIVGSGYLAFLLGLNCHWLALLMWTFLIWGYPLPLRGNDVRDRWI